MIDCFKTGSRVYGTPRPDSDLNLVVFTNDPSSYVEFASVDCLLSEGEDDSYPLNAGINMHVCKLGHMKIFFTRSPRLFGAFKKVSNQLEHRSRTTGRPITKDEAWRSILPALRDAQAQDDLEARDDS